MTRKPTEVCVFCGVGKPTKEHIFGKWMKQHVESPFTRTEHRTAIMQGEEGGSVGWRPILNRNGAPHTIQIKIACGLPCNNGWMSDFQENAKPHLLQLMEARWPVTSRDVILDIARWATMVTMSLEFAHSSTIAVTSTERLYLKEHLRPPDNWQIYVGLRDNHLHTGAFWHRAMLFNNGETSEAVADRPNAQLTTFHIGRSFFHVLSGPLEFLPNPSSYASYLGIRQIWPEPNPIPPTPLIFTHAGVIRVATQLFVDRGMDPTPGGGLLT